MPYLSVNLYHDHPSTYFEPDGIVDALREVFPKFEVQASDQLLLRLEKAEKVLTSNTEAEQAVLAKMKRDAAEQGPARAFTLTLENQKVQGVVKRRQFQLVYDTPLSEDTLNSLRNVIYSLHPLGEQMIIDEANC